MAGIPKTAKIASLLKEENVTKKLYADYSVFKEKLFNSIIGNEDNLALAKGTDDKEAKLILFKKTQKLMDRFLFIFFAEDRGLIPPNTISTILTEWEQLKTLNVYVPLYTRFKNHFDYINTGWKGDNYEVFAYNGGLFLPDEILDNITISDEVLFEQTTILTKYDFDSEVDVNILGHIFEHSLNEIETMNAELEGQQIDLKKTKRKKDGVFYTPKYITKYIVDNTIGKLCEEKKEELSIVEDDYLRGKKGRKKETVKQLENKLTDYRDWLLQITVVDPACGSGAFLNQALEFLIREHRWIDEMTAKLFGGGLVFQDVENSILENNLYGVDINEESVEIAKLSLWLRTAQKGRKLTSLNNNIKCGNSLIDDPEVAGDKAFKWEEEFPKVFAKGGFDVVIGNPPYGAKLDKNELDFIIRNLKEGGLSKSLCDTYIAFYIISIERLVKSDGVLSFIAPNTWRLIASGEPFRKYITSSPNFIYTIVQHLDKVFSDATVDCDTVFISKKIASNEKQLKLIIRNGDFEKLNHKVDYSLFSRQPFYNLNLKSVDYKLIKKIKTKGKLVSELFTIKNGIKPYEKGKGKPPQTSETMKTKPFTSEIKISNDSKPLIGGSLFNRYQLLWDSNYWIEYGEWLAAPRDPMIFESPIKLIFRQTSDRILGTRVTNGFYMRDNTHILLPLNENVDTDYALGVLNSRIIDYYYSSINPEKGEAMAQVKAFHLGLLVMPVADYFSQNQVKKCVNNIIVYFESLNIISRNFLDLLQSDYEIDKLSTKLQKWYELDFKQFVAELKKKKVELTLTEKADWMSYFNEKKAEAQELKSKIDETDNEIDLMVYKLYDLTYDEVLIVDPEISISREVYGVNS